MAKKPRYILMIALVSFLFIQSPSTYAAAGGPSQGHIRFGFLVGSSPDAQIRQWYPMINYLTDSVGEPFEITIRDSFEELLSDYESGKIDVLITGPYVYTKIADAAGARLIATPDRSDNKGFHGVIVTRSDNPASKLTDLKGQTFAFTEPFSTTGYLVPRIMMAEAGITQPADFFREVVFAGNYTDALEAVLSGRRDATAVVSYIVEDAPEAVRSKLKVIATTPDLPPEAIFANPSFDAGLREKIKSALLSMNERVPPDVMRMIGFSRFRQITDDEYSKVRQYVKQLAALPPVPRAIDFSQMPAALGNEEMRAKHQGWFIIMTVPVAAAAVFFISLLLLRARIRKDLKLRFIFTLFAVMVLIAVAASVKSAMGLSNKIENISLQWQHDIGSFVGEADQALSSGNTKILGLLTDSVLSRPGFLYVEIIRNGEYIADSRHQDVGHSIVSKVLSNTYHAADADRAGIINTVSYITSGESRWASALIGLDGSLFSTAVKNEFLGNLATVLILLGIGAAVALIIARAIISPVVKLHAAISEVRAGRRPRTNLDLGDDQIGDLSRSFQSMEAELARTDELLTLKARQLDSVNQRLLQIEEQGSELEAAIDEADVSLSDERATALDAVKDGIEMMCETSAPDNDAEELRTTISGIEEELPKLKKLRSEIIIGESPAFLRVIRDIIIRSRDSEPVLLYGESGSGKTGVAQSIHSLSARSDAKVVEYNCAELAAADPAIVLGKLFGYGKDCGLPGVSREGQKGLLEECDGATLFLDEIALLPLQAQGVLLLPLEGRAFNPAAGKGPARRSDVRFIFASNVSLEDEVRAGRFRNDLLRRLKSRGSISIAPLRDRLSDVRSLSSHFLDIWIREKGASIALTDDALAALERYDYGHFNVAELATAIKVAADNALFRGSSTIGTEHFAGDVGDYIKNKPGIRAQDDGQLFDAEELRELEVLRKHGFRISLAEDELGYSRDAKTITNHLRGLSFKALSLVDWNSGDAARLLAGSSSSAAIQRLSRKMAIYMANVERLAGTASERRLFNNLPFKYKHFVEQAVSRASKSVADDR